MSPMAPGSLPKPSEAAVASFRALLPPDPAITTRPMFGNLAAFVNGNMFTGLFGEDLFVRVSEPDQQAAKKEGGKPFEPMAGRAMTGYVVLAPNWRKRPDTARIWIGRSLTWARKLPAKASAKNKTAAKTGAAPSGKKSAKAR